MIEVPVTTNAPLKDGDVLFRIDAKPYQYVVDEKKAALAEAEQKVEQLKATLNAASAGTKKANAELNLAQKNYDRESYLVQHHDDPQVNLDTSSRNLEAAKESVNAATAEEERARAAYTANVEGVNSVIARARAELADAEFNLDQTTTRAAGPGFVTQVALRPGMYVIPTQLRTAMLFVNTGEHDRYLSAAFQQNSLQRVNAGDDAEVAFEAVPGRVFKAKVRAVVDAIAAGQMESSAALIEPETRKTSGRAVAILDIVDDIGDYQIPLGSKAEAAIYTQHLHDLSLLRKILLRMKSWKNYVFMEEG